MKKILLVLSILAPMGASASDVRSFDREFETEGAQRIALEVPVGSVKVEGTRSDRVEATVRIDCNFRKSRCREIAEDVDLVARVRGGELRVEVEGLKKWRALGLELEIEMRAPAAMELDVELGVGELEIEGFENDVTVDQGIGELDVLMESAQVDSVDIDAGVGEASVRYPGGRLETAGVFGNDLVWTEGSGSARVRLDLGIGEVDIRLR